MHQVERGFCPYSSFPIGPLKDKCPRFNRADLALREAFAPVLDGIMYPSKCSTDQSQLLPGTHCFCTGTQSDRPLKVRLTSRHYSPCAQAAFTHAAAVPPSFPQLPTGDNVSVFCFTFNQTIPMQLYNSLHAPGTACAVAGLTNSKFINCCGEGENDVFGSGPFKGFFLTGGGTYSGIDFWRVNVFLLLLSI